MAGGDFFLPHPRPRSVGSYFDTSPPESAQFETALRMPLGARSRLGGIKILVPTKQIDSRPLLAWLVGF